MIHPDIEHAERATQMAEHQPLPVAGYNSQSGVNIGLVNANKIAEENVLRILDELGKLPDIDKRWLAIARTHIEEAFMAANRAIFRPKRIEL